MNDYLDFLRYSLNTSLMLPESIRSIEWRRFLVWTEQQAITGVVFNGVERTRNEISIPHDVLLQWIGYYQSIERRNQRLNKVCLDLCEFLQIHGLECCILKGQGNAQMYPNPLCRASGDIDVWIRGKSVKETISFAQTINPRGKACYHHVDFGVFKGVPVEIHYLPSFMNCFLSNIRLQHWIKQRASKQFTNYLFLSEESGKIAVPDWEFNVVYQLSHIYSHLMQGGIGLRHMIDYYYLLKSDLRGKKEDISNTLRHLGLSRIAGAVMWIQVEILGLEEKYSIAQEDVKRGHFLFEEIMQGGNFGHYDKRVKHINSPLQRNLNRLKQDMRLMRYFPSECIWEPVFRLYHFFWRLAH